MWCVINATPRRLSPGKETRYPFYRRLGGPQVRCGWVRKISPPPGFDPWTAQPVTSRYTDWATPAHIILYLERYHFLYVWTYHFVCRSLLQLSANRKSALLYGSASWCLHAVQFCSASSSLIFRKFLAGVSRFLAGSVHPPVPTPPTLLSLGNVVLIPKSHN